MKSPPKSNSFVNNPNSKKDQLPDNFIVFDPPNSLSSKTKQNLQTF
jgi:hypothetical protein